MKKYDVSRHDLCVDFTKWNDIFKGISVVSGYMTVLVFQVFNLQYVKPEPLRLMCLRHGKSGN